MVISEKELEPFYDEKGYLSLEKIDEFLISKGVMKHYGKFNEPILIMDKDGQIPYHDCIKQINDIIRKRGYRKAGSMGVTKKTNDIDPDSIPI